MSAGSCAEVRGLSRRFTVRGREPVVAVDDVSLELEPGSYTAIKGRSGSGKTTLLALLAGLDRPTSGTVLLDGAELARVSRAERTRLARTVGFVFQGEAVIRRLPVWENVAYGLVPLGVPSRERRERATALLARVELEHLAGRRPEQLSTGERQRLALARALVNEPRIVIADEPTSNLDAESAAIVCALLAGEHQRGCTVLVASHDDVVLGQAERVLTMTAGRLLPPAGEDATS